MRGRPGLDELAEFVAARTGDLHRAAYLLTAGQERAEHLVETVIGELRRHGFDTGQGETTAKHLMARMAGAVAIRAPQDDGLADHEPDIVRLSPRERAVLMLRSLDGNDPASTARELGLSRSKTTAAEESACQSLGFAATDAQLRETLTGFADQATWPEAETTLAASARARLPRRHSRKRYVAVAAILALTAAALIGNQVQHEKWLRTPAGINASHGTHFHAYTDGYKLAGVQPVPEGNTRKFRLPADDAVAFDCAKVKSRADLAKAPVIDDGEDKYPALCNSGSDHTYFLVPATGVVSVHARVHGGKPVFVADYRPVKWDDYPVATDGFQVEHDQTLERLAQMNYQGHPVRRGKTLTMHGTNGVFTATIEHPAAAKDTDLVLSGLLSPTTTGWYHVTVDGQAMSDCGFVRSSQWCRIYDHFVPQVPMMSTFDDGAFTPGASTGSSKVRVEVRHALGPWRLQLRYDRYRSHN